jgi:hypothetical protein
MSGLVNWSLAGLFIAGGLLGGIGGIATPASSFSLVAMSACAVRCRFCKRRAPSNP